jgi:hypothetical protein
MRIQKPKVIRYLKIETDGTIKSLSNSTKFLQQNLYMLVLLSLPSSSTFNGTFLMECGIVQVLPENKDYFKNTISNETTKILEASIFNGKIKFKGILTESKQLKLHDKVTVESIFLYIFKEELEEYKRTFYEKLSGEFIFYMKLTEVDNTI